MMNDHSYIFSPPIIGPNRRNTILNICDFLSNYFNFFENSHNALFLVLLDCINPEILTDS